MKISEEKMRFLEEQIPELADTAVKQAYWKSLTSGYSVLEAKEGFLVEVFPDGSTKKHKKLPESTKVESRKIIEF